MVKKIDFRVTPPEMKLGHLFHKWWKKGVNCPKIEPTHSISWVVGKEGVHHPWNQAKVLKVAGGGRRKSTTHEIKPRCSKLQVGAEGSPPHTKLSQGTQFCRWWGWRKQTGVSHPWNHGRFHGWWRWWAEGIVLESLVQSGLLHIFGKTETKTSL